MPARRWQTWLVLITLTMRALIAPGFMVAPAHAGSAAIGIVLCTPQGFKLVSVAADGSVQNADEDGSTEPYDATSTCPFSVATTTLVVEPVQITATIDAFQIHHTYSPTSAFISQYAHFRLARGPPPRGLI